MTTPLSALQATLATEHAAVWLYAVLGGQTSQSASPGLFADITAGYQAHRSRRDRLAAALRDAGEQPAAAAAAYELPGPVGTVPQVRRAARDLERDCATSYAWLVANSVGRRRRWAVEALTDAAVRELAFQGIPEIFPGARELADR